MEVVSSVSVLLKEVISKEKLKEWIDSAKTEKEGNIEDKDDVVVVVEEGNEEEEKTDVVEVEEETDTVVVVEEEVEKGIDIAVVVDDNVDVLGCSVVAVVDDIVVDDNKVVRLVVAAVRTIRLDVVVVTLK